MSRLTLDDHLNNMNADTLKVFARKLELPKTVTRKGDLVSALKTEIKDRLAEVVGLCSEQERLCLSEAVYEGGKVQESRFYGKYGRNCPSPVAYYYGYDRPKSKDISPFPLLAYLDDDWPTVCVFKELVAGLNRVLKKPEAFTYKTIPEVPSALKGRKGEPDYVVMVHSGEAIVFDELVKMIGLVQAGKIRITDKTRRPTEGTLRLVSDALIEPDFQLDDGEIEDWETPPGPVRAHAWPVLLQQCGWCKPVGRKLELTRAGESLLKGPQAKRMKEGLLRLVGDDSFDELNRINALKGQTGKGKRDLTKPSTRRTALYEAMKLWPVSKWMTFDDAYRAILAEGYEFSVCRKESWYLYIGDPQYGHLAEEDIGDALERQYFRAVLMESLATLGLMDIAYTAPHGLWPDVSGLWHMDDDSFFSRYDGLLYVRLNTLGTYCLGATEAYRVQRPETGTLFKILPTLELALLQQRDLSALDRVRLEQFARPKSDYIWTLDRKHLMERLEAGMSIEQVRTFLTDYGENEIPTTVETLLNDLGRRAGAVKSPQEALLIEIRDRETAALIANDRSARKYCHLSGSNHVAVPKQHEKSFRKALKAMGYILPQ